MQRDLQFTVDSALLRELGEKLVETVHLALSELVKNSYDADATEVEIKFEKNDNGNDQIMIIDNGVGMSFDMVKNYWMRIATTNKSERNVSTVFGRPLTGAKGIGRFSCRRLGTKLTLITVGSKDGNIQGSGNNLEKTVVEFPWTEFEPGTDVTTIKCKGEETILKSGETGTTLTIEGVPDEWNLRGYNWLKRQLGILVANQGAKRKGFKEDPGFNLKFIAEDFHEGVTDLREELINAGWATIKAYINPKFQAVCELDALGIGKKKITSSITFPLLKGVHLELGIMVGKPDQMRDKSVLSKGTLQSILPSWGGVQVRFRNFRVYPYGDDDWLDIDRDRGLRKGAAKGELQAFAESLRGVDASRVLLTTLSMRSYVGSVSISDGAAGFEMKANREGFIESEATIELKKFVRYVIDWSTILRDFYLRQEAQKVAIIAKEEFEEIIGKKIESSRVVAAALNHIESEVRTIARMLKPSERREVENSFTKATEAIKKNVESTQVELNHLRLVASTSTLILIFSHEVKSLLGLLEQSKNTLFRISKSLPKKQADELIEVGENFTDLNKRLEELLQLTSLISTAQKVAKPGQVALKSKMARVKKVFELIIKKYDIELDYSNIPNNVVIQNILEAELYSILLNVLSNSIKAVIAGGKKRKIQVDAARLDGETILTIRDTGIGLDEENYQEVFTPFVADPKGKLYRSLEKRINPEDNVIVGMGSGLGLGIVKEIISAHNGRLSFQKPKAGWSTELEIRLK